MFFKNYGPPRSTRKKPTVHGTLIYGPPRSTCEKTTVHGAEKLRNLCFTSILGNDIAPFPPAPTLAIRTRHTGTDMLRAHFRVMKCNERQ